MSQGERKASRCLLINLGGRGNLGDRAMLLNVIRQIREICPNVDLYAPPHTPEFVVQEFNLTTYPLVTHCLGRWEAIRNRVPLLRIFEPVAKWLYSGFDLIAMLAMTWAVSRLEWDPDISCMEVDFAKAIGGADIVFFVGGGYLTDIGKFDCRATLAAGLMAIFSGKPVYMSGQGLGPIDTRMTKLLLKAMVPHAKLVTFRDRSGSENLLRRLHIPWKSGGSVGDDAMSLPVKEAVDAGANWSGDRLAVQFRVCPQTPNILAHISEFERFLLSMVADGDWQIDFFIFHTTRPAYEEDVIRSIVERTGIENYVVHKVEDPRQMRYLVGQCNVAIGIAYHFLVFALAEGVPAIGLWDGRYYKDKIEGLFAWYDKVNWTLSVEEMVAENLAKYCCELRSMKPQLQPMLTSQTERMGSKARQTIETALGCLEG